MRDIRLGDDIDDFCVRCKRVMNHAVVSVIAAAPAKVRCRTCHSDHDYRHEQAPPQLLPTAKKCPMWNWKARLMVWPKAKPRARISNLWRKLRP